MNESTQNIQRLVSTLFKIHGQPYQLTRGQCDIFAAIIHKALKWVWISGPTRYGKSEDAGLALLYLAAFHGLKVPIVGGTEEKANKIMEYITSHVGDHPLLYEGLINIRGTDAIDRLKIKVSKEALRWVGGGWIFVTSVDSRNISKEGERLLGEGGDVVFLEEAGLIRRPEQFSKIIRMPEGDWGKLVMSGNCIEGSVFQDAFNDPIYHKVRIGLDQAINEGRIDEERLAQQKKNTPAKDWKRLYLVEFPKGNEFSYFKPQKYQFVPTKGMRYYGAVDLALGESKDGSLVGITVLGVDNKGQVYEVESIGQIMTPDETIRTILNLPYQFERFGVEAVMFQRYFLKRIDEVSKEQHKYIPFQGIEQSKKKSERIESMEPFINTGQVLFKGENEMWRELEGYPDSDKLDVIDSLEMCWRQMGLGKVDFMIA